MSYTNPAQKLGSTVAMIGWTHLQMLEKSSPTSLFWIVYVVKAAKPTDFNGYTVSWSDSEKGFSGQDKQAILDQIELSGTARGLSRAVIARIWGLLTDWPVTITPSRLCAGSLPNCPELVDQYKTLLIDTVF